MPAIREGKVVSLGMKDTVVVEVFRMFVHPLYKKRIKRSQKHQAHYTGDSLKLGDTVKIIETRPISKNKHFKVQK